MRIKGSGALVIGANRGIGRAFVREWLKRGATRIYLGARDGMVAFGGEPAAKDLAFLAPATLPVAETYSASKSPVLALTRTLRAEDVFPGALSRGAADAFKHDPAAVRARVSTVVHAID